MNSKWVLARERQEKEGHKIALVGDGNTNYAWIGAVVMQVYTTVKTFKLYTENEDILLYVSYTSIQLILRRFPRQPSCKLSWAGL